LGWQRAAHTRRRSTQARAVFELGETSRPRLRWHDRHGHDVEDGLEIGGVTAAKCIAILEFPALGVILEQRAHKKKRHGRSDMQRPLFWHRPYNWHARWLFSFELPYSQLQIHTAGFPALEDSGHPWRPASMAVRPRVLTGAEATVGVTPPQPHHQKERGRAALCTERNGCHGGPPRTQGLHSKKLERCEKAKIGQASLFTCLLPGLRAA
jgi:hypothetical protein